jgi:hypothetical protein
MSDAAEKLNADILRIGAEAARIRANSAEFHILRGQTPPKLPDVISTTADLNPLRRAEKKKADADAVVRGMRETRLDFSAAHLPPTVGCAENANRVDQPAERHRTRDGSLGLGR